MTKKGGTKVDREQIEQLWSDEDNWTAGLIYHCPQDPRVIVPRRWRWGGWTLNFSHPRAGAVGIASVGLAVGPTRVFSDRVKKTS